MIILGAGPVAIEMAQAFSRLGTKVTVVQRSGQILTKEDKDMADEIMKVLSSEGVTFHLNASVLHVKDLGSEKEITLKEGNEKPVSLKAEQLLVAMGRDPNVKAPGLEGIGVEFDRRGVRVDDRLRTTQKHPCDVTHDDQIQALFERASHDLGRIDILVHSIAFGGRDELSRPYLETSRLGFLTAMEVSVYSFTALARATAPLMPEGGSMMTMTYYGSDKVMPNYNVMGVAKAALESSTRYLASDLGTRGIRVNAISAGPVRTLSAAGVSGFKRLYKHFAEIAPLRRNVTAEDVAGTAVWLASDMALAVTGEVIFVDSGYNILGIPSTSEGEG